MNNLISIVIPTYNRALVIAGTLDSVLKQTYENWECIIVDDRSSDHTDELILQYVKSDQRFKYYKRPEFMIKGPNSCRNFGYSKSSGVFIKWLDSDDLLYEKTIFEQLKHFDSDTDAVICPLLKKDLETEKELGVNQISSEDTIKSYLEGTISYFVSGPIWRRSFLEKIDLKFDNTITNLDDWDFNLRALYENPKLVLM
jgi:glycosyltransferase involved in cell wall biosynthesis